MLSKPAPQPVMPLQSEHLVARFYRPEDAPPVQSTPQPAPRPQPAKHSPSPPAPPARPRFKPRRAGTRKVSPKIHPECREAAEQLLGLTSSPEERRFWEDYLRVGDFDDFAGFTPSISSDRIPESAIRLA